MLLKQAYCPQHLLSSPSAQPQDPINMGIWSSDALQTGPSNPLALFCGLPLLVVCFTATLLRVHLGTWRLLLCLCCTLCHGRYRLFAACSEALGLTHFLAQLIFRDHSPVQSTRPSPWRGSQVVTVHQG